MGKKATISFPLLQEDKVEVSTWKYPASIWAVPSAIKEKLIFLHWVYPQWVLTMNGILVKLLVDAILIEKKRWGEYDASKLLIAGLRKIYLLRH